MLSLKVWFPLALVGACSLAAGCEDDRAVADLGPGGTAAGGAEGEDAGSPPAKGGDGMGGGGTASGGTAGGGIGGDDPGAGASDAGGTAGASGGAGGGAGGETSGECPSNIFEAEGKACAPDGLFCSDGAGDPCQFGQSIVCQNGKWLRQEAFPAPCGGAGGTSGAGGAASD